MSMNVGNYIDLMQEIALLNCRQRHWMAIRGNVDLWITRII